MTMDKTNDVREGSVWNTRRGTGNHLKILNMGQREQGRSPYHTHTWGWGGDRALARKHGSRLADGTTKNRVRSSRDFLWLHYREPAGRKERLWQGLNMDYKDLNLDHTSRKMLGNG